MSDVGFPKLGPDYTGFLHRHPPRPGYPEMRRHVVVDVEDWVIARQKAAESPVTSTNNRSDEIAFLESLQKCYFSAICADYSSVGFKMVNDRIAQLRAMR